MNVTFNARKEFKGFTYEAKFETKSKVTGILGASGSGKSMTLNMIAGLLNPDFGKIELNGKVLFDADNKVSLKPQARRTGFMFQNYALFPNMTVGQNIAFGIYLKREEKEEIILQMLKYINLEGYKNRYPSQLSGGQRQRVALARILASKPDILLLDEPFSALDEYLRTQMVSQTLETIEGLDIPVLFVSHSRDEIFRMCDDVIIMSKGNLISHGNKVETFDAPSSYEALVLTGCKNISPAKKVAAKKIYALDWGIELECEKEVKDDVKYAGIRAHNIRLGECAQENAFDCRISRIFEENFEMIVMAAIGDDKNMSEVMIRLSKKKWADSVAQNKINRISIEAKNILCV
ncbi:MAG: ATP-binding cassette domain-containing protein [Endomicrobium sp.]|jgi:molybdate transport system ATP-binding protein|nr:ATP-binding cassette domain-containing protein [Endomicrobium sp.]